MQRTRIALRRQQGAAALIALALAAMPVRAQEQRARPFMLLNQGPDTIVSLQCSPSSEQRWGPNMIGRVALPPGNSLHITPRERNTCQFDLRIVWAGGHEEERRGEDLCQPNRVYRVSSNGR